MRKLVALTLVCMIAFVSLITGCDRARITTSGEIPRELDKFSLTDMWNAVAQVTDLQADDARLGDFTLRADADGNVESVYFNFSGWNKEGRSSIYFADMGSDDKIDIRAYETDSQPPMNAHPSDIFSEIDKIGLASLERGDAGLTMQIDFMSGDIGYSYDSADIYHLQDSGLTPLKKIVFHSQYPWCTVSVFKMYPVAGSDGAAASSIQTASGPVPPGERTSQIWFIGDEVNRAETLEYLDT
jgi:hypothetical protein